MILVGVVLAVVVGLLRGGKVEHLADLGIKGLAFVWAALLIRFGVNFLAGRGFDWSWLQIGAYLLFLYVLRMNLNVPGIKLFAVGTLLNFLVITVNGGAMPVSAKAIEIAGIAEIPSGGTHMLLTEATKLSFLADIIPFNPPFLPLSQVISIGDILIVVGIFIFIQHRLLRRATITAVQESP